ncbi:MAG: putative glycoside hydrolase, partial [Patescibacteria group bacterium]
PFWEYIIALSKESYAIGFDELNYDYIRYPSDGVMADAKYVDPDKPAALEAFFRYLHDNVAPIGVLTSADLFGYVTVHADDLGIGQVLERALPYFDYIDPMVYPSHYNKGFAGLANVNSDPYLVVHTSLVEAVRRAFATTTVVAGFATTPIMKTVIIPGSANAPTTTKEVPSGMYAKAPYPSSVIRPWLQSFDYPVPYTPAMVKAQIRANEDAGLSSYLFWDPANKYTSLRAVLLEENGQP